MKNCYTGKGKNAKISLVEAIKDAKKGFTIEEAIYVYDVKGEKTEYIKKLYGRDVQDVSINRFYNSTAIIEVCIQNYKIFYKNGDYNLYFIYGN